MLIPALALALFLASELLMGGALQQPSTPADEGTALLQAGKLDEARASFEAVLSRDPANGAAQSGEVAACERMALDARTGGHMDEALAALLRARNFVPDSARLLLDLGILEDEMRLFDDADKSLARAELLNPDDPNVLYAMARVKMDQGQLTPAERAMEAYLKLRPADASAHFGMGRIYQIGLQFDKARAEFLRSAELQPVQTEAYYELGDLALKQGDFEDAVEQFSKTLARDPKHGGALEGSGEACFKQKHYDRAVEFLERAVAASPDYAPSHYYLGLTLARLGRKEESERELAAASRLADAESKNAGGQRLMTPSSQP